jgi:hypothetical protein
VLSCREHNHMRSYGSTKSALKIWLTPSRCEAKRAAQRSCFSNTVLGKHEVPEGVPISAALRPNS